MLHKFRFIAWVGSGSLVNGSSIGSNRWTYKKGLKLGWLGSQKRVKVWVLIGPPNFGLSNNPLVWHLVAHSTDIAEQVFGFFNPLDGAITSTSMERHVLVKNRNGKGPSKTAQHETLLTYAKNSEITLDQATKGKTRMALKSFAHKWRQCGARTVGGRSSEGDGKSAQREGERKID